MIDIIVETPKGPQQMLLQKDFYLNPRNTALRLYYTDEEGNVELWSTLTVNIKEKLPAGCVAIKDYSEGDGNLEMLLKAGIVSEPIYFVHSGFVDIPVCQLINQELL